MICALAIPLSACSSGSGSSKSTAATTPAAAPASTQSSTPPPSPTSAFSTTADAATVAAVSKAYTTFFDAKQTHAALVADLQNGPKLSDALTQQAQNPTAKTLSAKVTKVTLQNPHVALVTFTLLSNGSVLLANTPGKAVLEDGTWKLAAETFCGLVAATGKIPPICNEFSTVALPTS